MSQGAQTYIVCVKICSRILSEKNTLLSYCFELNIIMYVLYTINKTSDS